MDNAYCRIFQLVEPHNRLIELRWLCLNTNSLEPSIPPIQTSFTNLSVLEIFLYGSVSRLSGLVLPALRYLSLFEVEDETIPLLLPFMETNGPRLLGLVTSSDQVCSDLHEIFKHCTALTSAVMDDMDAEDFLASSTTCLSLTHIGIRSFSLRRLPSPRLVRKGFPQLLACFPGLRVIRILADDIPPSSRDHWGKPAGEAALKGVRMEDKRRRLLTSIS